MREMVRPDDQPESRQVLVFIDRADYPDVELSPTDASLERIRKMHEWFDNKSEPAREVIQKLGGIVLDHNWFWAGLRVTLPADGIETSMASIRETLHVSGVHFPE